MADGRIWILIEITSGKSLTDYFVRIKFTDQDSSLNYCHSEICNKIMSFPNKYILNY